MPDRLLRIHIPKDLLAPLIPFGDTLDSVAYNREYRSTTGRFLLDGFIGRLGLYDQQALLAELSLRSFATKYASVIKRVFGELKQHSGPYAPRVIFDPVELPDGTDSATVSFLEPSGRDYHGAEVRIVEKNASGKPSNVKFSVSKQY